VPKFSVDGGFTSRPIVVRYGDRRLCPAVDGVIGNVLPDCSPPRPTLTRVALPMSAIMDPACVLILDGRLDSLGCAQGRWGSCNFELCVEFTGEPGERVSNVVMVLGVNCEFLAEFSSSKGLRAGSSGTSSCSRRTSDGPNELAAKGDRMEGREVSDDPWLVVLLGVDGLDDPEALIISALTDPITCRTIPPCVGVTITGASLRNSLE
jgi:hypothetical protein